jgi:transposase
MTKVELFEVIRRDKLIRDLSIREIAREHGVHRRMVRQAIASAVPPRRKPPERRPPVFTTALRQVVDAWLRGDQKAPRKQRHTGRRIWQRLRDEHGFEGAESTVRRYVGTRRRELGLKVRAFVPQVHQPGMEGEVDFYEAQVDFVDGRHKVYVLEVRACHSGREMHVAFRRQSQQAFLEGISLALTYFGGVFAKIRFDNLSAAVRRVLRGRRRLETDRFVALRSHYLFESVFCQPGLAGAPEKGGVESGVGRFRRRWLVPVPRMAGMAELNRYLLDCCARDDMRCVEGRSSTIAEDWERERPLLLPLPAEPFDCAEVSTPRVDGKSRIKLRLNHYSVPVRLVGLKVEARLGATTVDIYAAGKLVAQHDRLHGRHQQRLELDHYLPLLHRKPGALPGAAPLWQMRREQRWPPVFDRLWQGLVARHGEIEGARQMVEVLLCARWADIGDIKQAAEKTVAIGAQSSDVVIMLLRRTVACRQRGKPPALGTLGALARFERPIDPDMAAYDALLPRFVVGGAQ